MPAFSSATDRLRARMRSRRTEVDVAAGQGQPVGVADDRRAEHLDVQVEIPHHPLDAGQLLGVLLPEHGQRRVDDVEQLEHHGQHAVEVAGPGGALQHLARAGRPRRVTCRSAAYRSDTSRREDEIDALGLARRQVVGQRSGVAGEVLVRAELQRVDEDADHHPLGAGPGQPDQRAVAVVQRPHGRNERGRRVEAVASAPGAAYSARLLATFTAEGPDSAEKVCSAVGKAPRRTSST